MIFKNSKKGHRRLSIASGVVSMALFLGVFGSLGTARAAGDVAKIGNTTYASVSAAITAAKAGDTVTLIANSSSDNLPNIDKNISLDLNGFTYESKASNMYAFAVVSQATLTIKDSTGKGKIVEHAPNGIYASVGNIVLDGGTIEAHANYALSVNVGSITVNGGKIVANSGDGYGIYAYNKNQPKINVTGGEIKSSGYGVALADCSATFTMTGGKIEARQFALATNGGSEKKGTMKISGGEITSESIAVYLPSGSMTISGGTITAETAVYMKSGNLEIKGGSLNGIGPATPYKYYNNGAYATGDALVVDNCGYPNGAPVITVSGGTFTSKNAKDVGTYSYGDENKPVEKFIKGGIFSQEVAAENCVEGYRSVKNDDGTYTVSNIYTVSFDVEGVPSQQVVYGQKATKPADPVKDGYKFVCWMSGDVEYDFSIPVTMDLELKAKWEEAPAPVAPSFADFVERLYNVALGRPSEKEGKDFWVGKVTSGEFTGGYCALFFLTSPEFLSKNTTDDEFLTTLYKTFFDREPEAEGMAFWQDFLKKGNSRQAVIERFVDSTEWCNLCAKYGVNPGAPTAKATVPSAAALGFATRLYTKCLDREPEQQGLKFWALALTNREVTGAYIGKFFFESDEYVGKNTSNEDFVTALYSTFVDRAPDKGGYEFWVGKLNDGISRSDVLRAFVMCPEFGDLCRTYGFDRGEI